MFMHWLANAAGRRLCMLLFIPLGASSSSDNRICASSSGESAGAVLLQRSSSNDVRTSAGEAGEDNEVAYESYRNSFLNVAEGSKMRLEYVLYGTNVRGNVEDKLSCRFWYAVDDGSCVDPPEWQGKTKEECQDLCNKYSNCKGIEYHEQSQICALMGRLSHAADKENESGFEGGWTHWWKRLQGGVILQLGGVSEEIVALGANSNSEVWVRPSWRKQVRCDGPSIHDCEECVDKENCWYGTESSAVQSSGIHEHGMHLKITDKRWTRHIWSFAFTCGQDDWFDGEVLVPASLTKGGLLIVRYNGVIASPTNYTSEGVSAEVLAYKLVSTGGPGEIEVEFIVDADAAEYSAYVRKAYLTASSSFVRCVEKTNCLGALSAAPGQEGMELRMNNIEQLACLIGGRPDSSACKLWLNCLSDDSQSRLRTMLLAAGVRDKANLLAREPLRAQAVVEEPCGTEVEICGTSSHILDMKTTVWAGRDCETVLRKEGCWWKDRPESDGGRSYFKRKCCSEDPAETASLENEICGSGSHIPDMKKMVWDDRDCEKVLKNEGFWWKTRPETDGGRRYFRNKCCAEEETGSSTYDIRAGSDVTEEDSMDDDNDSDADAEEAIESSSSVSSLSSCINPAFADPESFTCACYDEIAVQCHASNDIEACFQEVYCKHPLVCPEWKTDVACSVTTKEELLLERRAQHDGALQDSLDETVNSKSCQ